MSEKNTLHRIEAFVFEWFEIRAEFGSQQELVDEGLVAFIGKEGRNHFSEEPWIFFPEEEVQFMAGKLRILEAFFLFLEIRPVEDELKLPQGCVLSDSKEVIVSTGKILKNLKPGGVQVSDLESLAFLEQSDRVLFGEMAIRVESPAEAQIRDFGRSFRKRNFGVACTMMIEDEDVHVLAVPEGIEVNGKSTLLVRLQVGKAHRAIDEEVDRASGGDVFLGLLFWSRPGSSFPLGRLPGQSAIVILALHENLPFCSGITHGPGIQDDLGALEHVAWQLSGVAALEDVAEFIADLAATDVEVWQVAGGAAEESPAGGMGEKIEEVEVW